MALARILNSKIHFWTDYLLNDNSSVSLALSCHVSFWILPRSIRTAFLARLAQCFCLILGCHLMNSGFDVVFPTSFSCCFYWNLIYLLIYVVIMMLLSNFVVSSSCIEAWFWLKSASCHLIFGFNFVMLIGFVNNDLFCMVE